jgi:hypothetical protein
MRIEEGGRVGAVGAGSIGSIKHSRGRQQQELAQRYGQLR